jgi:RNA polymerase sigma factor (TIGR02999 family)
MDTAEDLTQLISAAREGDRGAGDRLFRIVYDELKRLAHAIRAGRATPTLGTTALVHEAWLKLSGVAGMKVENRLHFKHLVARAMRHVVVDEARARTAGKRGGGKAVAVSLDGVPTPDGPLGPVEMIRLHESLEALEAMDERAAAVVDCRFFGGLTVAETAEALGTSTATVKRDWSVARAWLTEQLG